MYLVPMSIIFTRVQTGCCLEFGNTRKPKRKCKLLTFIFNAKKREREGGGGGGGGGGGEGSQ